MRTVAPKNFAPTFHSSLQQRTYSQNKKGGPLNSASPKVSQTGGLRSPFPTTSSMISQTNAYANGGYKFSTAAATASNPRLQRTLAANQAGLKASSHVSVTHQHGVPVASSAMRNINKPSQGNFSNSSASKGVGLQHPFSAGLPLGRDRDRDRD